MARSTVQEYLGVPATWPVKEKIKQSIVIMPNKTDIRTAKRQDPKACALHNAACRMFDIPNCAIGGRWAYIPQRDAKGNYYIARMQAPQATQRAIKQFDKTGEMPEGGFLFMPIAPSHTYKEKNSRQNARNAALRETPKRVGKKREITKRMKPTRAIPRSFSDG